MAKPFKLPSSFTLTKVDDSYQLSIKQVNPFYVGLHIIIILIFITLSFNHIGFIIVPLIFIGFIISQFSEKYDLNFNSSSINIDGSSFEISSIKKILLSRKTHTIGVHTENSEKVSILIATINGNEYVRKSLIEDNQQPLIYLLKKVLAQDFEFIDKHLTK